MTVNAITDTKKGRTGIAPTYLHTTPVAQLSVTHKYSVLSDTKFAVAFLCLSATVQSTVVKFCVFPPGFRVPGLHSLILSHVCCAAVI